MALAELGDSSNIAGRVCDVTDKAAVHELLEFAIGRFGRIDAWINNAGTHTPTGRTSDVAISSGELTLSTNILGTYYGSVVAMRQFRKQSFGRVINIVGRGEKGPVPGGNLYTSSKAWVRNFTIAMARETDEAGIDVCTFNPGFMVTALTTHLRVLPGYESMYPSLKKVIQYIGESPDNAARELAELALRDGPARVENGRSRVSVLLPKVLRRMVFREAPPIDPESVTMEKVEPED